MKLIADANVLLSAVLGGRAARVLTHPQIEEVLTPQLVFEEVEEYALILAGKRKIPPEAILLAVASLPISVVERKTYERSISEARRLIERRDPDDIDVLALALHLKLPLWSNDNDFTGTGIEWFTTAEVLKILKS